MAAPPRVPLALYRFARHLTGSDSDGQYLVQETYARALGAQKSPVLGELNLEEDDRPDIAGELRITLFIFPVRGLR